MREQKQIPLEDLIKEKEIFSPKSDPELDVNDNDNYFFNPEPQRQLKLSQKRAENQ